MQQSNRENAKGWRARVEEGIANLAEKIEVTQHSYNDRPRKAGVPFQIPPLPAHFVERPEHENPLKAKLLQEHNVTSRVLLLSAIRELGGIGKSVLATKLVHDREVQQRFADGVLWVTLGQKPDLLPQLAGWIRALGDDDFQPTALDSASTHLRTLLYNKQVLLVVDDVWNPEHIHPFCVGGDRSRMLITTRRTDIADEVGAERYLLDLMTPQQALALLSVRLHRSLDAAEQAEALRLAQAVGYLPIALDLVAAQIAQGISWRDLYDALERDVARLEALDPHCCQGETYLKGAVNLSLQALQAEITDIWENFIWLGVLPEDVLVAAPMLTTLWEVTVDEAAERLERLWQHALLLSGPEITVQDHRYLSYRIHDLLHDIACQILSAKPPQGLKLTVPMAHAMLLERYQMKIQQGQWHTLPNDGYIHAHLTWHLEQANRVDTLHQLLQETTDEGRNGWYEACDRLGQTATFVTDVARAWQLAEQQYDKNPAQSMALQLRYALIMMTLNSWAHHIPAPLMGALVRKGLWTPAQGLAYARQAQESQQRAAILHELAGDLPTTLLPIALKVARSIQSGSYRTYGLSGLAPYLPPALLPEALQVARSIQDESSRAFALSGLAPYLPTALWLEALQVARSIQDEYYRAKALNGLAPYLPKAVPEALQVIHAIWDESDKAHALNGLAPYLPTALWSEALQMARLIQDEYHRASALRGLAQYLPAVVPEALQMARLIQDEYHRASALRGLAQYLPAVIPEALQAAREIQNEPFRAFALSGLIQYLPEVISEAMQAIREIQNESFRASALRGLAQYLPAALWPEVVQVVREIQDESYRAFALRGLAQHLPEVLLPEALQVARELQDESYQAFALSGLAQYLPEVIPEVLQVARSIRNHSSRASALSGLAPYLPEVLLPEALQVARSIQDQPSRASALSRLAPYLPEATPNALQVGQELQDESYPANVLSGLLDRLDLTNFEFWCTVLRTLARQSRPEFIHNLPKLSPAILALGGKEALQGTVVALREVCGQWR